MSKTVVLAEKPSVGRDIARVLRCSKKGNGFLEGSKYIVTWALGHLVTLANPEVYDKKFKTWKLNDLPMLPKDLELVVIRKTSRQFNTVRTQLNRKDVKDIVIATDAGREGELVARWILEKTRVRKPVKRLWISSVTDQAIRDGFKQLKPGKNYENLYAAAVARSEADWYVGLNATRALTTKFNAQLSSGRVQTPTLAIIAARENEIQTFKSRKYYGIEVRTNLGLRLKWQDQNNQERIFSKKQAERFVEKLTKKQIKILSVHQANKKTFSPQLYDLTELQREANRLFGYSGKETLSIMQHLYERHKVLTYPRTDSRHLSTDLIPTLKNRLQACGVDQYSRHAKTLLQKTFKLPRSVVDNSKVSDHHAIIPTEQPLLLHELNDRERKIYDLVIKRFLAVLSDPYEYKEISIHAEIDGERFYAREMFTKKYGWKAVYGNHKNESDISKKLQHIKKGDHLANEQVTLTEGETKPPGRFTEGTLLHAMENPSRYMGEREKHLVKTINKTGGLGTVATRADIIEKLFDNMYMEKKGQSIFLTAKGRQLLDLVPEDLRSPALTAEWEQKLERIAEGTLNKNEFINEMKNYAREIVQQIKQSDETFKHDNLTGSNCPKCQKFMLEIDNRHGKMLVCQDRSCGHRRSIFKRTNARCPNCRKRLNLYGEGEGQTFVCQCGHREKLSTFNKRRQQEKRNRASKKDVNKYLKKQDEGFKNNALAEALAKFKK